MSERSRRAAAAVLAGLCVAGCGSGVGLGSAGGGGGSSAAAAAGMSGMSPGQTSTTAGGSARMRPLGVARWKAMKIQVSETAPSPFEVSDGQSDAKVPEPRHASLQMVVDLTDARTGVQIPYATVLATVRQGAKVVSRTRQFPMLSEALGSDYVNNVALPGPGRYELSLLIGPPLAARHLEYAHVWLKQHTVRMSFHWSPTA